LDKEVEEIRGREARKSDEEMIEEVRDLGSGGWMERRSEGSEVRK